MFEMVKGTDPRFNGKELTALYKEEENICGIFAEGPHPLFICNRQKGHEGQHVAIGRKADGSLHVCAIWD